MRQRRARNVLARVPQMRTAQMVLQSAGKNQTSASPPASASKAEFKPPTGSWEDEVVAIDACEGNEGTVVVYLTWKGGHKTQHPLAQVYKRCPQKVRKAE